MSLLLAVIVMTPRLYVLDCGMLNIDPAGVERYHVTQKEVVEPRMPVPCFLVVHPKGTLLWDAGVIPDADVENARTQIPGPDLAKTGRLNVRRHLQSHPPERNFHPQPPEYEFSVEQSAASRAMIEEYLKKTNTAIWIEHDYGANAKLKKSPA